MRVFVAGASGAIGRRLVPQLVEGGHEAIGATRTPGKTDLLRELGAEPVVLDARDDDALRAAAIEARPDAIVNQLTDLPADYDVRRIERLVRSTNELRLSSTRTLLDAARELGSPRRVPAWLARLVAGTAAGAATQLRGASNAKAKRELGWQPAHPSWREGFALAG